MAPSSTQEPAVLFPLVLGLPVILITIGVHAVALAATVRFLRHEYQLRRAGIGFWKDVVITAGVTLLALFAHLIDIAMWAVLYVACGEFTALSAAFDHSAENYTSLGYGNVVMSASWKLFGPLEATNGLLMFGVSAAMIFATAQRLFRTRVRAARPAHTGR
jgi:hypothetical protein